MFQRHAGMFHVKPGRYPCKRASETSHPASVSISQSSHSLARAPPTRVEPVYARATTARRCDVSRETVVHSGSLAGPATEYKALQCAGRRRQPLPTMVSVLSRRQLRLGTQRPVGEVHHPLRDPQSDGGSFGRLQPRADARKPNRGVHVTAEGPPGALEFLSLAPWISRGSGSTLRLARHCQWRRDASEARWLTVAECAPVVPDRVTRQSGEQSGRVRPREPIAARGRLVSRETALARVEYPNPSCRGDWCPVSITLGECARRSARSTNFATALDRKLRLSGLHVQTSSESTGESPHLTDRLACIAVAVCGSSSKVLRIGSPGSDQSAPRGGPGAASWEPEVTLNEAHATVRSAEQNPSSVARGSSPYCAYSVGARLLRHSDASDRRIPP